MAKVPLPTTSCRMKSAKVAAGGRGSLSRNDATIDVEGGAVVVVVDGAIVVET